MFPLMVYNHSELYLSDKFSQSEDTSIKGSVVNWRPVGFDAYVC